MEIANIVFRLLAASQILLFLVVLVLSANAFRVRMIGGLLCGGIFVYFIMPLLIQYVGFPSASYVWLYPSSIPCLTLFFVWVVFEEHCNIPFWLVALLIIDLSLTQLLPIAFQQLSIELNPQIIAQAFKICLVIGAVYIIWQGRDNDLVEMRLKVRWYFIASLVLTVLGVAVVEMLTAYNIPVAGEAIGMAWMFLLGMLINVSFIRLNPSLDLLGPQTQTPSIEQSEDPQVNHLLERMRSERLYSDHDLRVGSLADIVGMPEYQLRKKINQTLGFRNFNQFVNSYRIEEAGERLLSESRTPVLSIALDVGFRSISSFNSAFQAHFGVSPTAYRSQRVAGS